MGNEKVASPLSPRSHPSFTHSSLTLASDPHNPAAYEPTKWRNHRPMKVVAADSYEMCHQP
jgi:hypothetical protein